MHERQVHHGHLVNDQDVCLQRIFPVSEEAAGISFFLRIAAHFKKPMDRLSLISCRLGHPLCRPSRWRCKKNAHPFTLKKSYHRVDRRCLSRSRTSGEHKKPMFDRFYHGAVLHWIKLDLFLFFHLFQPALHHLFRHFTVYVQIMEHLRRIQFQIIIVGRIDPYLTVRFFHHCLALDTQIHDIFFDILNLYFQQRTGSLQQNLLRKINMPLSHRLLQCVKNTAFDPIIRICMDSDPRGDLIRGLKTYPFNIVCQLIRILLQNFVNFHPVIPVDLCSKTEGDSVFLKIDHRLAHILLLFHLYRDLPRLSLADPLDLRKPFRLFLYNSEGIFLKPPHDPCGKSSAHSLDRS